MRLSNLSQQNVHDFATYLGTEGPWNSQISLLQRGKHDPKAQFWVSFGALNKALADDELLIVTDIRLREKLKEAMPLLTEDGSVATASQLFAMFIGEHKASSLYAMPIQLSDEEAAQASQDYRERFRKAVISSMTSPREVWDQMQPHCIELGMTSTQANRFREVLVGLGDYTGEELTELTRTAADEPIPSQVLSKVP